MKTGLGIGGVFHFTCHDGQLPYGNIKWQETAHNVVTSAFCRSVLDIVFEGSVLCLKEVLQAPSFMWV
ncbi:MAG: hypothetical protein ACXABY_37115 [Candidatus Thorarchaeota archaeon]|jgi:hypothetical protein